MAEWRNIEEFNGAYQVSDDGQVRNANNVILRQHYAGGRIHYPIVVLCNGSAKVRGNKPKYVRRYVHRLVADAFLQNPQGKREVNHIDSNPLNNAAQNLEWVTHIENVRHAYKDGNATKKRKKVIRDDGVVYESLSKASAAIGYDMSNLSKACRYGWRIRGHLYRYADQMQ